MYDGERHQRGKFTIPQMMTGPSCTMARSGDSDDIGALLSGRCYCCRMELVDARCSAGIMATCPYRRHHTHLHELVPAL